MSVKRIVGGKELADMLLVTEDDIRDFIMPRLDSQFRKNMIQQFATEGSSGGARWKPLTKEYQTWKSRYYPGRKILERTGELRKSFSFMSSDYHIARYEAGAVYLGSSLHYAKYHTHGTPKMVARNPIQHTKTQSLEYGKVISDWVRQRVDRVARIYMASGE